MNKIILYDNNDNLLAKAILVTKCSVCGKEKGFELTERETEVLRKYICYGRQMGTLQKLFPRVPAWIRSGCIDQYSNGFCICPDCCGQRKENSYEKVLPKRYVCCPV